MKTKKERKERAWKEYKKIVEQAEKEYDKIENPAYKKYQKIVKPASEKYQKVIKEINKKSEFNLSKNVHYPNECAVCKRDNCSRVYFESDIKEFIKLLKELYFIDNKVLFADIILKIDELAGERLK